MIQPVTTKDAKIPYLKKGKAGVENAQRWLLNLYIVLDTSIIEETISAKNIQNIELKARWCFNTNELINNPHDKFAGLPSYMKNLSYRLRKKINKISDKIN